MTSFSHSSLRLAICLVFILLLLPETGARGDTPGPADVIVVFNKNMAASADVARYYAARRGVPEENLLGLALPETESMSRSEYETLLAAPLRPLAQGFTARGRQTIVLLVYGVPLKVGSAEPLTAREESRRQVEAETIRLAALVRALAIRLMTIADPGFKAPAEPSDLGDAAPKAIELAGTAMARMADWGKKIANEPSSPSFIDEAATILFRLAGLTRLTDPAHKASSQDMAPRASAPENAMTAWKNALEHRLALIPFYGVTPENALETATLFRAGLGLVGELQIWNDLRREDGAAESSAAVDSELTLLLAPSYVKARWLPNPFLPAFDKTPGIEGPRQRTLMTSRLDGPTPEIARRLVDDAMAVEGEGLTGTVYLDARWPLADGQETSDYARFDTLFHSLAALVRDKGTLPVVLDSREELFAPPCCPEAALYCGWYSLARYQEGPQWKRGAVAYHVASGEAATLRNPDSNVWCKRILEQGVAATIGPVQEPYLHSFPRPDQFFPLLMTGKMSLVQVYFRTSPFLSWRQVLIGDPLYTPFRHKPAFSLDGPIL